MNFPLQCKWVTFLVTLVTALLICTPNGQLAPTSGLKEHYKLQTIRAQRLGSLVVQAAPFEGYLLDF